MSKSITLVTAAVDLARSDRSFDTHYLKSLERLAQTTSPLVIYTEKSHWDHVKSVSKSACLILNELNKQDLEQHAVFSAVEKTVTDPSWYQQAAWMQHSVIRSAHYIMLTLLKLDLVLAAANTIDSDRYVWLDSGVFSSYGIQNSITSYDLERIPADKFFITSFPYKTTTEIHGFNVHQLEQLAGTTSDYVCRATVFSASRTELEHMHTLYWNMIMQALSLNCIGTEESIFTILSLKHPDLFDRFQMQSGDISEFLNTLT